MRTYALFLFLAPSLHSWSSRSADFFSATFCFSAAASAFCGMERLALARWDWGVKDKMKWKTCLCFGGDLLGVLPLGFATRHFESAWAVEVFEI